MIKVEHGIPSSVGDVTLVTMKREQVEVVLADYGASVYSFKFNGREMTVRPDDLDGFLNGKFYYGKTCGRTGGRLIAPSYEIDGMSYPVKPHGGETTKLHGGKNGFSFRHFELVSVKEEEKQDVVTWKLFSPDGDEDYPGDLTLFIHYILDQNNRLRIQFEGNTTKDTLCSVTNHMYFNLNGKGTINQHHVKIDASHYVELNEDLIPISKSSVKGTPFDLRELKSIEKPLEELSKTPIGGFDHTWIFDHEVGHVTVMNDQQDYQLDVSSNYPAVVMFAHNIPSTDQLPSEYRDGVRSSLAIECEFEPGGIHFPYLNSGILRKNESYQYWIDYTFTHFNK